jgi:hypothetical protein
MMVRTLNHSYVVDRIWQAHLEGREHGFTALKPKATAPGAVSESNLISARPATRPLHSR